MSLILRVFQVLPISKCFSAKLLFAFQDSFYYAKNTKVSQLSLSELPNSAKRAVPVLGYPYIASFSHELPLYKKTEFRHADHFFLNSSPAPPEDRHTYRLIFPNDKMISVHVHVTASGKALLSKLKTSYFIPLPVFLVSRCEALADIHNRKTVEANETESVSEQTFAVYAGMDAVFYNAAKTGLMYALTRYLPEFELKNHMTEHYPEFLNTDTSEIILDNTANIEAFLLQTTDVDMRNLPQITHFNFTNHGLKAVAFFRKHLQTGLAAMLVSALTLAVGLSWQRNYELGNELSKLRALRKQAATKASESPAAISQTDVSTDRRIYIESTAELRALLERVDENRQQRFWLTSLKKQNNAEITLNALFVSASYRIRHVQQLAEELGMAIVSMESLPDENSPDQFLSVSLRLRKQ